MLDFFRPSNRIGNAFIELFGGKARAECLGQHWFMSVDDAAENAKRGVETITRRDHIAISAMCRRYRW
ncbi:hypothetical protein ABIB28_003647 [Sphingomonas sp. UYEF23]